MGKRAPEESLHKHWVHSHEEDTNTNIVFRPADFPFPPSRGRKSFELQSGGRFIDHPIAPDDRQLTVTGKWKMEGDSLTLQPSSGKKRVSRIVSLDAKRLILEK